MTIDISEPVSLQFALRYLNMFMKVFTKAKAELTDTEK